MDVVIRQQIQALRNAIFSMTDTGDYDYVVEEIGALVDAYLLIITQNVDVFEEGIQSLYRGTDKLFQLNPPHQYELVEYEAYTKNYWISNFFGNLGVHQGNPFLPEGCLNAWLVGLINERTDLDAALRKWYTRTVDELNREAQKYGKVLRPDTRIRSFENFFDRIIKNYPLLNTIMYLNSSRSFAPPRASYTPPRTSYTPPGSPRGSPTRPRKPRVLKFTDEQTYNILWNVNNVCEYGYRFKQNWMLYTSNIGEYERQKDLYYRWRRPASPMRRPRSPSPPRGGWYRPPPRRQQSPPRQHRPRSPPRRQPPPPRRQPQSSLPRAAETCYTILGVPRTATQTEIKKQFHKLSLKEHPDKGGDASTYKLKTAAYRVLSDPDTRARYDKNIRQGITECTSQV